ncbi:Fpg/Nei family DNA glycosylase [Nocardioides panacis]|uniref:Fpg/Nei family DNA glycosylase n=1 Tax=Nocardioides panacis TaxID=2849501 RepID=A0A975Y158_9ACTN|nr:DNA-formamidopyrimidine glycosylase family protein [Nocardioides panacis]QWZ09172.1 Fpg/Nei family DNA glycosylase [Nocardioides panacis]
MPEGDTVWRTALHLDKALSGQVLLETDFRVPAHATLDLSGRTVQATVARGKHLLTRIGPDHSLHTHLKMEGSWHLYRPGTGWRRPAHEARVVLRTEEWTAVGFALGVVEVVARDAEDTVVGHLGPDLLGPDWDEAEALRRLRSDPSRPVADALLDQRNLAGIGNLYKNELCFLAGAHPRLPVCEVPDLPRLVRRARTALEANKNRVEQTLTGDTRRGKQTWVYRRDKQPCRRCGTRIRVDLQGPEGQERATYWCPACQPPPTVSR